MRLTLRTMLCYLDDVLEPADAKELAAKIEESEYATNVVHRIRTSMRRLRLGAPGLGGKSIDPNKVADYLDNTLPPEEVAEFERVCLDAETENYLAEVAACHQILTLVLGEPAEVPPPMRHRIYGLGQLDEKQLVAASLEESSPASGDAAARALATNGDAGTQHRVDGQHVARENTVSSDAAATGAADESADKAEPARKEREKPEIPEYLKQGRNQRAWPMALVVLLLVILLGGIAVTLWPPGGQRQASITDGENENPAGQVTPGKDDNNNGGPSDEPSALNDLNDGAADGATAGPTTAPLGDTVASNGGAGNGNVAGEEVDPLAGGGNIKTPAGDGTADPTSNVAGESGVRPSDLSDDNAVARVDEPIDVEPPAIEDGASDTSDDPVLPPVDKVVAHYISTAQVMVGWDTNAAAWMRLPPRAQLKPGAQVRSLPTYRPQLLLTNDIQITFADEGIAAVGNPADGIPSLELVSGQAVVATMGEADRSVLLRAGIRDIKLTMVSDDAAIALSVKRFHLPGSNPETDLPHVTVVGVVTGGQVNWQTDGAKPMLLDVGQQISMLDDGLATVRATDTTPAWVKTNDISDIDRLASATLEPMMDEDRPMEIVLAEKVEHPRVEVRSLAARSLATIDRFDALVDTFNDESLKSYWSEHYDHLQAALARGPETATLVHRAVQRRKGDEAERVFRLLQGYNPEQLKSGSDRTLVEYLKHPSLDVRVLAINNLRRITSRTFGYHPHLPDARRRTPTRQWEDAAADGSIVYLTPPPELPKRKPAS